MLLLKPVKNVTVKDKQGQYPVSRPEGMPEPGIVFQPKIPAKPEQCNGFRIIHQAITYKGSEVLLPLTETEFLSFMFSESFH
jgi:hypothetical protein